MNHQPSYPRRPDLDLLRVSAVLLLFPFHTAKVYDPQPWYHVWSPDLIPGLQHATAFVHLWHMPLLFLLAGWAAVASLRHRSLGAFLRERRTRLLLPLAFGVVVLCPIIKYVELRSGVSIGLDGVGAAAWLQQAHGALQARPLPVAPPFDESFLAFLPTFFTPARITWSHLWFVAYLLVLSVLLAPLFAWAAHHRAPARHSELLLWTPALLLALSELLLRPHWPGVQTLVSDWANLAKYAIYLAAGALLAACPTLEASAHARWRAALTAGMALALLPLVVDRSGLPTGAAAPLVFAVRAVAGWCLVVAALGIGARIARPGPRLAWLATAAMPIYVLHQLGVVLAAWWLDGLPVPAVWRLVLVLAASIAAVLLFYLCVVQRVGWLAAALGSKAVRPVPLRAGPARAGIVLLALLVGCGDGEPPENPLRADGESVLSVMNFSTPLDLRRLPSGWRRSDFRHWGLVSPADISFGELDGRAVARLETDGSGSILFRQLDVPVTDYPLLHWSWRVDDPMECPRPETTLRGDDHPVGLLLRFAFDTTAGRERRTAYLVWGNRADSGALEVTMLGIAVNASLPYIVVRGGSANVGRWFDEEVDLGALFRRQWPDDPAPRLTEIGLVADADNCGGRSLAFVADLQLGRVTSRESGDGARSSAGAGSGMTSRSASR